MQQDQARAAQPAPQAGTVEVRSIDYVPLAERHGKAWHLGPLWFMANAELVTLAVGLLGPSLGANLFWSIAAILLGALFGTFFMAFHSAQGPHLGLPQMIQSRAQFGYLGVLFPFVIVISLYVGFNVFNVALGGAALKGATGLDSDVGLILVALVAIALAGVGYRFIHVAQRWLTYSFVVIFGVLTIGAITVVHLPAGQLDAGHFSWTPFLVQFGAMCGYQLSWAPYVSDYSRYLPPTVKTRSTLWWTYGGSVIGAVWLAGLGAFLAAANPDADSVGAVQAVGNDIFSGFGDFALLFAALGLVSVAALNLYGGSLTLITMADSFRSVRPTVRLRLAGVVAVGVAAVILALVTSSDFLTNFGNFLSTLIYFMIPWTAVNLVDFYFVRKGRYAVREIFNPNGIYGRWGWRGLTAYFAGFAASIPFFSTGLYTGPVADALGGADIAIFIGLPVSAIVYLLLGRGIDLERERRVADEAGDELELEALAHERPVEAAV